MDPVAAKDYAALGLQGDAEHVWCERSRRPDGPSEEIAPPARLRLGRGKGCAKNYVSRAGARVGLMSTNHFSRYGSRMR